MHTSKLLLNNKQPVSYEYGQRIENDQGSVYFAK